MNWSTTRSYAHSKVLPQALFPCQLVSLSSPALRNWWLLTFTQRCINSSLRLSARINRGNGRGGNVNRLNSRGHMFFRSLCNIRASAEPCQLNIVPVLGFKHRLNLSLEDAVTALKTVLSFLAQNNLFRGLPKSLYFGLWRSLPNPFYVDKQVVHEAFVFFFLYL
jgi:hypothetical protein